MPRVLREYKRRSVLTASNCCKLLIVLFLAGLSIQHTTSFLHADAEYFAKEYVSNVAQDVANNVVNMVNNTRQYLRTPNNIDFNLGFSSSAGGGGSEDDSNDEADDSGSSDSSVDQEEEQKEETEEVQPVQGQDEEPPKQEPKEANEPVEEDKQDDQDKSKESTDNKEEAKEESTPETTTKEEEEQEPTKDKEKTSTENDEQATTKAEEKEEDEPKEKESKDEAKQQQQQQDKETSVKDTEVKAEKEQEKAPDKNADSDKMSDEQKEEETQPDSSKVNDQKKKEEEPTQNDDDDEKTEKKKKKNKKESSDNDSDNPKNDDRTKQNDGETTDDKKESSKGADTEKSDNETKQDDGQTTDVKKEKKKEKKEKEKKEEESLEASDADKSKTSAAADDNDDKTKQNDDKGKADSKEKESTTAKKDDASETTETKDVVVEDDNNNKGGEKDNNKSVTDDQDLTDAMNSPSKTLYRAVTEATQLLYRDSSSLLQWVTQPLPRIYVYDNIPDDWSDPWEVSNCVDHALGNDDKQQGEGAEQVCSWQPQVCQDTAVPFNTTNTLRYNYNSDVGLLELFRKYPSRTDDPKKADLFVVPYPYWSHCLCSRTRKRFYKTPLDECPYDFSTMDQKIQLPHWTEKNKNRHLWILGVEWDLIKEDEFLNKLGVSLTVGAAPCKASNKVSPCPVIVHPYFSTGVGYQPNKLLTKSWWKKPLSERKFAVTAVHSTPDRLEYRKSFYDSKDEIGQEIGGKRVILDHIGTDLPQMTNVVQLYRSSMFCLVLPGDYAVQRRFFDVILNGCIPVVPVWYRSRSVGWPSAHQKFGASVSASYPYARGLPFFGDRDAGIDYVSDLMVTFNATCGIPCFQQEVERVMANTTELQRLQKNLQTYAPLFTYGLQDAAYSSMDAFAALLVSLRHYVMSL